MISLEEMDGVCVVRIPTIRLDSAVGTVIRNTLTSKLDTHTQFVLDMSAVKLVDSGGLGALVSILKSLSSHQAALVLAGMQKSVRLMFELSRMDRQFRLSDTLEQAFELVKPNAR